MRRLRVSPASAIATVALFIALGGAAWAGAKIGTKQIENGAVTAKKLAKGAVKAKAIAPNAVKGKAVVEDTLGTVPSADSANSAVTAGGLEPSKFSARLQPNSAPRVVATSGTLDLEFGCSAAGAPLFRLLAADGADPQTTRYSLQFDSSSKGKGEGTLPASGLVVLDGSETGLSFTGDADSLTENGEVTTIQWAARSTSPFPSPNPDGNRCLFWGTSLAG